MIYLIRHGQTEANEKQQYLGRYDSPLTAEGMRQHQAAIQRLDDSRLNRFISSPRARCEVLADALGKQHGADVTIDERIAELNFGIFERLTFVQAKSQYPNEWAEWEKCDSAYALPDGESSDAFEARGKRFCTRAF